MCFLCCFCEHYDYKYRTATAGHTLPNRYLRSLTLSVIHRQSNALTSHSLVPLSLTKTSHDFSEGVRPNRPLVEPPRQRAPLDWTSRAIPNGRHGARGPREPQRTNRLGKRVVRCGNASLLGKCNHSKTNAKSVA